MQAHDIYTNVCDRNKLICIITYLKYDTCVTLRVHFYPFVTKYYQRVYDKCTKEMYVQLQHTHSVYYVLSLYMSCTHYTTLFLTKL